MITGSKKWYYLAVKKLPALFKRITPNHDRDFYCFIVYCHLGQKIDLKNMKIYLKVMIIAI